MDLFKPNIPLLRINVCQNFSVHIENLYERIARLYVVLIDILITINSRNT